MDELKPTEKIVLQQFTGESKDASSLMDELDADKSAIYRALNKLVKLGYIELDGDKSAFTTRKFYRLKKLPDSGITFVLPGGLTVSFNTFLKGMALAPDPPRISTAWVTLPEAMSMLAFCAAKEMVNPGSVTEVQLLEPKVKIQEYVEILQQQYAICMQMLKDEQLWDPKKLVDGALRKTDFFQTPADIQKLATLLFNRYLSGNIETEGEEDNDD